MARAIALAAYHATDLPHDLLRRAIVLGCALALIGAGRVLPVLPL